MPLLLPFSAAVFCCGVAMGGAWDLPVTALLLLAGGAALATLVLRRSGGPATSTAALLVAVLACGAALGARAWRAPVRACHVSRATGREVVRLLATVEGDAVVTSRGWRRLLRARRLERRGRAGSACGAVELHGPPGLRLRRGEQVLLRARLRPAVGARNPGPAGARLRHLGGDVGAVATVAEQDVVVLRSRPEPALERIRQRVRENLAAAVSDPTPRGLVGALVLGDRSTLPAPVRQRFARAGVSHLLAISGLHLALVAGALLVGLRWLLLWVPGLGARTDPRRFAAAGAALATVGYTLLTGGSPSTVRACVMVCACSLGLLWHRAPDLARPLSLAALVLLVLDPLNLWRPGFQLSFCAVIGIVLVHRRVRESLARRASITSPAGTRSTAPRALRWMGAMAMTTTAATLATAPVVAHHFGQVSVAGLATNIVAIPWTTLVLLPLGLSGAAVGLVAPAVGVPLLAAAGWAAALLDRLCALVASWDLAVVTLAPGWPVTLGLAASLLGLVTRGRSRLVALVLAAALLGAGGVAALHRDLDAALELTFLDVGQGDSTLARFPDGTTVLVDGGGSLSETYDPGAARVVPYLRAAGVTRLDLVVATHPHPDHVKGLAAVLASVEVGELWACWHQEENPWHEDLLRAARRRGIRVTRPRLLRRGEVVLRPIWPEGYDKHCGDPGYSANDNSVVLRLEYGRAAALLPGDIEREVERLLVRGKSRWLRADLLKAPHHGSGTSSSAAFIRAVSPRLTVISCGLDNSFGIPPPRVVARYRRLGVPLARVDLSGAVGVRLHADGRMTWRPLVQ